MSNSADATLASAASGSLLRGEAPVDSSSGATYPTQRLLGSILGWAAALVAVRSPVLSSVLSPTLVLVLLAVVLAVLQLQSRVGRTWITSIDVYVFGYSIARILIEVVDAYSTQGRVSLGACLDYALLAIVWLTVRIAVTSVREAIAFVESFVRPALFVSALAIVQLLGGRSINDVIIQWTNSDGLANRIAIGADIRATSTIGHWTALGGYLAGITALVCFLVAYRYRTTGGVSGSQLVLLLVLGAAQVATLTFATVGIWVVIVVVTLWRVRVRVVLLAALAGLTIGAMALFGALIQGRIAHQTTESTFYGDPLPFLPESVSFRIGVWTTETIPTVFERPTLGFGMDVYNRLAETNFASRLVWISPESEWLRTAVSAGLVGLALQVVLIVAMWRAMRPFASVVSPDLLSCRIFFFGLITISMIHAHITNRGVPIVLYVMVAAIYSMRLAVDHRRARCPRSDSSSEPARRPVPAGRRVGRSDSQP